MREELAKRITALPQHQQECVAAFIKGWQEQNAKRLFPAVTTQGDLTRNVEAVVGYYEAANRSITPLCNDLKD